MNVNVSFYPPIPVACVRHTGPYDQIGPKFDQLWQWIEANGVPAKRSIGIYYDNPEFTPAKQLRSAACAELPDGYTASIPLNGIELMVIPGGNYAVTRFVGPYENLEPVWSQFTNFIENVLGKTIKDTPAFEVYVNDAANTPPEQLITELFMPVD